jgi:hypothetical protein
MVVVGPLDVLAKLVTNKGDDGTSKAVGADFGPLTGSRRVAGGPLTAFGPGSRGSVAGGPRTAVRPVAGSGSVSQ